MTLDELMVVVNVFDLDFNPQDEGDIEWLNRSLENINKGLKQLHKKKK